MCNEYISMFSIDIFLAVSVKQVLYNLWAAALFALRLRWNLLFVYIT